jgi:hypothetical protein
MKGTIITILSFLFFLTSKAQVAEFLSLQSATTWKDSMGNFLQVNEWIGQEIYIKLNLGEKKVQFFSKGMVDRDTFTIKKEIFLLNKSTSPDIVTDKMMEFPGIDKSGEKCVVRLNLITDKYKMQGGELQVVYLDRTEIYKIRNFSQKPKYNKS